MIYNQHLLGCKVVQSEADPLWCEVWGALVCEVRGQPQAPTRRSVTVLPGVTTWGNHTEVTAFVHWVLPHARHCIECWEGLVQSSEQPKFSPFTVGGTVAKIGQLGRVELGFTFRLSKPRARTFSSSFLTHHLLDFSLLLFILGFSLISSNLKLYKGEHHFLYKCFLLNCGAGQGSGLCLNCSAVAKPWCLLACFHCSDCGLLEASI